MGGTLRWMSPELLSGDVEKPGEGRASFASDMYAVAMAFWEVRTYLLSPYRDINVSTAFHWAYPLRPRHIRLPHHHGGYARRAATSTDRCRGDRFRRDDLGYYGEMLARRAGAEAFLSRGPGRRYIDARVPRAYFIPERRALRGSSEYAR